MIADWGPGSGRDQTGVELNLEWRVQCPGDGSLSRPVSLIIAAPWDSGKQLTYLQEPRAIKLPPGGSYENQPPDMCKSSLSGDSGAL